MAFRIGQRSLDIPEEAYRRLLKEIEDSSTRAALDKLKELHLPTRMEPPPKLQNLGRFAADNFYRLARRINAAGAVDLPYVIASANIFHKYANWKALCLQRELIDRGYVENTPFMRAQADPEASSAFNSSSVLNVCRQALNLDNPYKTLGIGSLNDPAACSQMLLALACLFYMWADSAANAQGGIPEVVDLVCQAHFASDISLALANGESLSELARLGARGRVMNDIEPHKKQVREWLGLWRRGEASYKNKTKFDEAMADKTGRSVRTIAKWRKEMQ